MSRIKIECEDCPDADMWIDYMAGNIGIIKQNKLLRACVQELNDHANYHMVDGFHVALLTREALEALDA